jgi:hypothetical protein
MGRVITLNTGKNTAVYHARLDIKSIMLILYQVSNRFDEGSVLGSIKHRVEYLYNLLENLYIHKDD